MFGASLPILTTRCFSEVLSRGVVTTTRLGDREGVITLPVKLFTMVGLIVNLELARGLRAGYSLFGDE